MIYRLTSQSKEKGLTKKHKVRGIKTSFSTQRKMCLASESLDPNLLKLVKIAFWEVDLTTSSYYL
jgi:hypothetical protein